MVNPYTIQNTDIQAALGVSRTTLWRFFRGKEMAHIYREGRKYFIVADVITRLRQRPKHNPETEIILLNIDKLWRQTPQTRGTKS